jgi:hypothetical protein
MPTRAATRSRPDAYDATGAMPAMLDDHQQPQVGQDKHVLRLGVCNRTGAQRGAASAARSGK